MKKIKFFLVVLIVFLMFFSVSTWGKNVAIQKTSATDPSLIRIAFQQQPRNININSFAAYVGDPVANSDIWLVSIESTRVSRIDIAIEGPVINEFGIPTIARGSHFPDDWMLYGYADNTIRGEGKTTDLRGEILIIAVKGNGSIKASSPTAKVSATKGWSVKIYPILVRQTLSTRIGLEITTSPPVNILSVWSGSYFSFTNWGYREEIDGGWILIDVWQPELMAPPKGKIPVFVDQGTTNIPKISMQTTAWGKIKGAD